MSYTALRQTMMAFGYDIRRTWNAMSDEAGKWQQVWKRIDQRRVDLGWSLADLYRNTDTSESTYSGMRRFGTPVVRSAKRRQIELGLGWPKGTIEQILDDGASKPDDEPEPPVGSGLPPDDEYWIAAKSGANLGPEDRQLIVDMVHRLRARQVE